MNAATLYWNQTTDYSNVVVEDEEGNRSFEREVSKGDNKDGWFAQAGTAPKELEAKLLEEFEDYLERGKIEYDHAGVVTSA